MNGVRTYGFLVRPKWIGFHVLVVTGIVVMILLGFWQLDRLDARREFNATVESRAMAPTVSVAELADEIDALGGDADAVAWRPVTARGSYLDGDVLVFNRSQGGVAGDSVLTPLRTESGETVLVNRGFVRLGTTAAPAPTGEVEVFGRARPPEERRFGQLTDAASGPLTEIRRIDLDRLAPQFGGDIAPFYIELVSTEPPLRAGQPVPVVPPVLDEGPHLSYAVQWFIFAACVGIGWVLAVRRSLRTRRMSAPTPERPLTPV